VQTTALLRSLQPDIAVEGGAQYGNVAALSDTTGVTFNGTAAAFNVISGTEISETVPVGATTGKIEVTTPKKTLRSNVAFRVMP
jgi:hypothetical protein